MEGLIDGKIDKVFLAYTKNAPAKGNISSVSMAPTSARSKPGWASKKDDKKLKTPGVWRSHIESTDGLVAQGTWGVDG